MAALAQPTLQPAGSDWSTLTLGSAAALSGEDVLGRLESSDAGLSDDQASERLAKVGNNALRSHGARPSRCSGASCTIRC
jgi:cation transport ATPase-like protein